MIRQNYKAIITGEYDNVLRAISRTKRHSARSRTVDVAANFDDWKTTHNTDVDATIIIPVNDQSVGIPELELSAQHLVVEPLQCRSILHFNGDQDVRLSFFDYTPRIESGPPRN